MIRALRAFAEALRPLTTLAALWDAAASTSACPEGKAREAILDSFIGGPARRAPVRGHSLPRRVHAALGLLDLPAGASRRLA
jgi:hypothetical protein